MRIKVLSGARDGSAVESFLLFQRIRVWFPAPTSWTQLPLTPGPGIPHGLLTSLATCAHVCIPHTETHMHDLKSNKVILKVLFLIEAELETWLKCKTAKGALKSDLRPGLRLLLSVSPAPAPHLPVPVHLSQG